jgi:hypothetical protein
MIILTTNMHAFRPVQFKKFNAFFCPSEALHVLLVSSVNIHNNVISGSVISSELNSSIVVNALCKQIDQGYIVFMCDQQLG